MSNDIILKKSPSSIRRLIQKEFVFTWSYIYPSDLIIHFKRDFFTKYFVHSLTQRFLGLVNEYTKPDRETKQTLKKYFEKYKIKYKYIDILKFYKDIINDIYKTFFGYYSSLTRFKYKGGLKGIRGLYRDYKFNINKIKTNIWFFDFVFPIYMEIFNYILNYKVPNIIPLAYGWFSISFKKMEHKYYTKVFLAYLKKFSAYSKKLLALLEKTFKTIKMIEDILMWFKKRRKYDILAQILNIDIPGLSRDMFEDIVFYILAENPKKLLKFWKSVVE